MSDRPTPEVGVSIDIDAIEQDHGYPHPYDCRECHLIGRVRELEPAWDNALEEAILLVITLGESDTVVDEIVDRLHALKNRPPTAPHSESKEK